VVTHAARPARPAMGALDAIHARRSPLPARRTGAVKRMGKLDDLSREFACEHGGSLWHRLVLSDRSEEE